MATGGIPTPQTKEFQNSCSLCFEPFGKDRCPKFLPCHHTFCDKCLSVLEASVATATPDNGPEDNQQAAEDKDTAAEPDTGSEFAEGTNITDDVIAGSADASNPSFLCPTCRVPVHLPEGGVVALQTNFYVSYDVAMCDVCPEGSQQRADVFCQDCDKHLCPSCRRNHDKWTSGHHVTALSLGQPARARSEKKAFCLVHQDQTLCFQCRQCDTSICVVCKLTTHEGHATSDIASAVVRAKSELPSLLTEVQKQLQVVQTTIRHTERQERHLSRLVQNVTRQINTRYDLLVATMTQSRDELLEELSDREEQARSQLQSERNSASVSVDTLSGLVSRASCASGNDVISIKKELQAALLSEDSLNHHRQRTVRQDSWPGWAYDVPEVSVVPATACMERVVEVGADDVIKPLSVAELADKLDRLENDMTETKAEATKTKADVSQNKADLSQTKMEVSQNKADLTQTKMEVSQNKADMTQTKMEVSQNKADLTQTKMEVSQNKADLTQTKMEVSQNKANLTQTKMEVSQNKADLTQTKMEVSQNKADLSQTKTEVTQNTTQINTISTSVKEQADKMDKAGTRLSFHAKGIDKTKTKLHQPIVFREVTVTEGGGYQQDTGVFTAPVTGTYIVSAGVSKAGQSGDVEAWIKVDGAVHAFLVGSSSSTGSYSLALSLSKGQTVCVMAWSDVDDYDDYCTCYFTGVLVQPQL